MLVRNQAILAWENAIAATVVHYINDVLQDMSDFGTADYSFSSHAKHWGELKGFSLALQTGKENLGETATRLNRMIGFGPLMPNLSQVVDIDSKGNYVRDQGGSWGEYMLHMAKIQKLMVDKFGVKARNNAISGGIAELTKTLGGGSSAEND